MATYAMAIGKKEKFYIGLADLSDNNRLEIPVQEFRYPEFIRTENFDKEIRDRISKFFSDFGTIVIFKSDGVRQKIHKTLLENKQEFDEFDSE